MSFGGGREADFKIATLLWVFRNLILSYCKFLCNYSAWSLLASCTFGFIIFIEFWAYSLDIFLSHFSLIFLPNPFRASIMWILDWLLDIVPHVTEVLFTFFILFFPLFLLIWLSQILYIFGSKSSFVSFFIVSVSSLCLCFSLILEYVCNIFSWLLMLLKLSFCFWICFY